jgi:hypothetical protein
MTATVAVVAAPGAARAQVAKCVGDAGLSVVELDDLAMPLHYIVVVVIDERGDLAAHLRSRVESWLTAPSSRVVVMTPKPVSWSSLARANDRSLLVLAAPAFGWQIVDAVRAVIGGDSRDN